MRTLPRWAGLLLAVLIAISLPTPASADVDGLTAGQIREQVGIRAVRTYTRALDRFAERMNSRVVCPVPGSTFVDSWGAPRDGHTHIGVDMMAPDGTTIVAPQAGVYRHHGNDSFYLDTPSGQQWFGTHLQGHVRGDGPVNAGDPIALVGHSGNASPDAPHLHLEQRPAGEPVNPYPAVNAACNGQPVARTSAAPPRRYYQAPRPTFPYGVVETHLWFNSFRPQPERIGRAQAVTLTRYLNAVVVNALRRMVDGSLVWHWQGVADCESGDNIYAVSSSGTYRGWLQFDQSSWAANGGSGDPYGQPREVAARIAENYRLRSGTSPWPHCGVHYRP